MTAAESYKKLRMDSTDGAKDGALSASEQLQSEMRVTVTVGWRDGTEEAGTGCGVASSLSEAQVIT